MKVIPLAAETTQLTGATHKLVVTAADVATIGANAAGTVQVFPTAGNIPLGYVVEVIGTIVTTKFDSSGDAAIVSLTAQIGDGGSAARYLAAQELSVDGANVVYKAGNGVAFAYVGADNVKITFTSSGGGSPTCVEIDSGVLEVYLRVTDLNALKIVQ